MASQHPGQLDAHPLLPMSGHLTLGWRGKPLLAGWIEPGYFRYETVA
jgi:hypothetical protein